MKKYISVVLSFTALLIITCGLLISDIRRNDDSGKYLVVLNEISHLSEEGDNAGAGQKADELSDLIKNDRENSRGVSAVSIMCVADIAVLLLMGIYFGKGIIYPFGKLMGFAERVAMGDMDIPLDYSRSDYFGKFTWAFDHMRREITKARACEKEAIENNKTVIASLSHDIKTPAASIRAYAEALEMGMDSDAEKRSRYLEVIMRKCDEVAKLTDDMFLHSLSDLDKLKITPEKVEICGFVEKTLNELYADQSDIIYEKPMFTAEVNADKGRTAQIIENIVNNARKYAKTEVSINLTRDDSFVCIHFRDRGKGIPDEDMPFIFNKFYRGRNCGDESGSGLGLFIVRYIAKQSGGDVKLKNHPDGLEVTVSLPLRIS